MMSTPTAESAKTSAHMRLLRSIARAASIECNAAPVRAITNTHPPPPMVRPTFGNLREPGRRPEDVKHAADGEPKPRPTSHQRRITRCASAFVWAIELLIQGLAWDLSSMSDQARLTFG